MVDQETSYFATLTKNFRLKKAFLFCVSFVRGKFVHMWWHRLLFCHFFLILFRLSSYSQFRWPLNDLFRKASWQLGNRLIGRHLLTYIKRQIVANPTICSGRFWQKLSSQRLPLIRRSDGRTDGRTGSGWIARLSVNCSRLPILVQNSS